MTAKTGQNFSHWAGDSQTLEFTVEDSSGNAVNITGSDIVWSLFKSFGASAELKKDNQSGGDITIVDASKGRYDVEIKKGDTSGKEGIWFHQTELTDSGGNVVTVSQGKAIIYGTNQ